MSMIRCKNESSGIGVSLKLLGAVVVVVVIGCALPEIMMVAEDVIVEGSGLILPTFGVDMGNGCVVAGAVLTQDWEMSPELSTSNETLRKQHFNCCVNLTYSCSHRHAVNTTQCHNTLFTVYTHTHIHSLICAVQPWSSSNTTQAATVVTCVLILLTNTAETSYCGNNTDSIDKYYYLQ